MKPFIPEQLKVAFENDRIAHSYLFYGQNPQDFDGSILAFFKGLLCEEKPNISYCDSCFHCKHIERLTHPDLVTVNVDNDGSSNKQVGVNIIRDKIIRSASLTACQSDYKLFWLNDIGNFTTSASNTLLKVLEEPPGQAIFVLTCRSLWDTLDTIRSRCQWVRFTNQPKKTDALVDMIGEKIETLDVDEELIENWLEVLHGKQKATRLKWSIDKAKGFLTLVLFVLQRKYAGLNDFGPESLNVDPQLNERLNYRLVHEILERWRELEFHSPPILVINSLLEEIYFPEESTKWQNVI